ncbi:anthranilate synthase component I family protein [Croceibacter atlanticus]|uniref:Para-aminobenzoate synthase, component I n=1 Tax=Croceibacter atlanticus (strain ATCC BAA-628 / JCM 21780 / CIP 108009 / IAM 15332 / KCTC 12090 / HTCC2559) TaxID=216432 RepID=A3U946_CROAH|nr:anthranilate synthase component I family protein [Croceibacter atlanticus]EAP86332.1 para-aminobenzoate synthase, component I [Croceibacter atlanticus HTCC2559]MBW4971195.1 anthranilate synthase component I family protein [Croceibacter atlanticus]
MRVNKTFTLKNTSHFKQQLLQWSQEFNEVVWLDSNLHTQAYSEYDAILAVDGFTVLKTDAQNAFEDLKTYQSTTKDWLFGYLSYDLKNDTELLTSNNFDGLNFPDLYFFQPKKLWLLKDNILEAHYLAMVDDEIDEDFNTINTLQLFEEVSSNTLKIKLRTSKDDYFKKLNNILEHIHRGDIYEANFCQEFYTSGHITPLATYKRLNVISKPPFASFVKLFNNYALCASPERYLKKSKTTVVSQPIKGTSKRSKDKNKDNALKKALENDPKERSENIMIVDLVRNDLSKTASKGSVTVQELCKVYTFEQVHQLISTVTSQVSDSLSPIDVLQSTFPMGSMTGAPKVSAMKIIEEYEDAKRGLYSGAIGYITPNGDFDFNVVIRSILYNAEKAYISYSVGGAITANSIPEKEYEECLIKAKAMREALLNNA